MSLPGVKLGGVFVPFTVIQTFLVSSSLSERQFALNMMIRSAAFFDDFGVTTPQNET